MKIFQHYACLPKRTLNGVEGRVVGKRYGGRFEEGAFLDLRMHNIDGSSFTVYDVHESLVEYAK